MEWSHGFCPTWFTELWALILCYSYWAEQGVKDQQWLSCGCCYGLSWFSTLFSVTSCYTDRHDQKMRRQNEEGEGSQEGRGNKNNNLPLGWNSEGDWWTDVFCHHQPSSVWNKGISNPANTVEHVCLLRMQGWLIFMSGIQTNFGNNGDWERGKDQQVSNSVAPLVHGATRQPSLWHPHCCLSRSFLLSFCDWI